MEFFDHLDAIALRYSDKATTLLGLWIAIGGALIATGYTQTGSPLGVSVAVAIAVQGYLTNKSKVL